MFLYFDDVIRIRSGDPVHNSIFSTVARTHAISEKPDTSSRYRLPLWSWSTLIRDLCNSIGGDRLFRNMMGTQQGKWNFNKAIELKKEYLLCETRHSELKEQPLQSWDVMMCWSPLDWNLVQAFFWISKKVMNSTELGEQFSGAEPQWSYEMF